jgi:hypothetical protein
MFKATITHTTLGYPLDLERRLPGVTHEEAQVLVREETGASLVDPKVWVILLGLKAAGVPDLPL